MGMRADQRVIQGLTHEQWRESILAAVSFDPGDYLEADEALEKELNEKVRKINLALLHLDALFGLSEATKITYRMAAEASADKFRIELLDGKRKQAVGFEGTSAQFDQFKNALLRGEVHLPPKGGSATRIPADQIQRSTRAQAGAQASGLNAAQTAADQEVFRA